MAERARHAFGSSDRVAESIANGVIDSYDILFLDGDTDNPKIGWVSKDGKPVILRDEKADLTELEAEVAEKANAAEVENSYEKIRYEITDVPVGTLVDYRDEEIRVCCPTTIVWTKQAVGTGGDANCYYCTFKTYAPSNDVVGYVEHLNGQVDKEVLTDLKTDKYGRKYQPTWLALAKYDEASNTWSYYGDNSTTNKYIGYDYQIDWYNADGVMIASDSIRINLSNAECHSSIEPYYVGKMMGEIDNKIAEATAIEVIEF